MGEDGTPFFFGCQKSDRRRLRRERPMARSEPGAAWGVSGGGPGGEGGPPA